MFSPRPRKRKARVVTPTVLTSEMGPVSSPSSGVNGKSAIMYMTRSHAR